MVSSATFTFYAGHWNLISGFEMSLEYSINGPLRYGWNGTGVLEWNSI